MSALDTSLGEILRYQEERTLDEVPAYHTGLQLRLNSGESVYLALSDTEFGMYFDAHFALHYDLECRLVKISEPHCYLRRSLSGRVLLSTKRTREEGGGLAREILPPEQAETMLNDAHGWASAVHAEVQAGSAHVEFAKPSLTQARETFAPLLPRAVAFDAEAAYRDTGKFRAVYGRVAVLPPDQYNALVLQVTEGCSYGRCLFCKLYEGVHFRRKTPAQFRLHLEHALAYHGEGLRARRSIFLGEANALTLPQPALLEIFQHLHEYLELAPAEQEHVPASWWMGSSTRFDGICSFLDAFSQTQHSADDFRALRRLGLRRVYIGMESGDNALLHWLKKPATDEMVKRCVASLKEAGVSVGVIVLLGAGGHQFAEAHVRETARVLNQMALGTHDYVYFSPLVIQTGGKYATRMADRGIGCLTDAEMLEQEQTIREALEFDPSAGRPYLARYDLQTFVY